MITTSEEVRRRKCEIESELEDSKHQLELLKAEFDEYKKKETKVSRKGQIKIPDYENFEFVRSSSNGGSLLTAVRSNLQHVFISGREQELGILVIQVCEF